MLGAFSGELERSSASTAYTGIRIEENMTDIIRGARYLLKKLNKFVGQVLLIS
jgi:hypothetical protein